jgi:hypothetical protein
MPDLSYAEVLAGSGVYARVQQDETPVIERRAGAERVGESDQREDAQGSGCQKVARRGSARGWGAFARSEAGRFRAGFTRDGVRFQGNGRQEAASTIVNRGREIWED